MSQRKERQDPRLAARQRTVLPGSGQGLEPEDWYVINAVCVLLEAVWELGRGVVGVLVAAVVRGLGRRAGPR